MTLDGRIERGNLAVSSKGSKLGQAKDRGIGRKAEKSVLSQPQSPNTLCGREQQKGEEARFPAMESEHATPDGAIHAADRRVKA